MSLNHLTLWNHCLSIIKDNVPELSYSTWFIPIVPLKYEEKALLIQVPSHFFYEQLENQYAELIGKALLRITGENTRLLYQVMVSDTPMRLVPESHQPNVNKLSNIPTRPIMPSNPFDQIVPGNLESQLNANLNFGNFIGGESNMLARTAGFSIAEKPGKTVFNPLFVHGKSGVGKTHLLHAIGNAALHQNSSLRVLYVSSHLFQVQYSQAYLNNTVNDFIHFYQSIDILLIDDIHELSGKTGTQNVFFHIFNHLHQNGRQLVITCDRPPKDIAGIDDRLLTRFKWGLTAEMEKPNYALRIAILESKILRDGLHFPKEVIEYIAQNATENVRDLEGIVVSLMAHSVIYEKEVDLDLTKRVVSNAIKVQERQISVELIEEEVCKYFDLEPSLIHTKSKKQEISQARQIAMYLSRKYTDKSYSNIGEMIGKRDHATVLHACKTVGNWIETDKKFKTYILDIEQLIQGK
ncbi:MAG: chromosomal replication initiator protein DnaA [Bacteroidales bacterium]|nr:chromosomal replication initiator protein DnaA [Bacteroidales bacterium]